MSVDLSPANQLGFPRPLTQLVKRSLVIHNPNPHPIAFKVKTTAPKQYSVRPNSGRVESGESIEVSVLLQALPVEPPPHAKCKDKFLVQSAYITPDEEMRSLGEMWAEVERTNKSAIHEQKVKCAYLPAEDGSTGANGIPEEDEGHAGETSRLEESQIYANAASSPIHAKGQSQVDILSDVKPDTMAEVMPDSKPDVEPSYQKNIAPALSLPLSARQNAPPSTEPASSRLPDLTAADIGSIGASPTNVALESSLAATTSDSDKLKVALAEIDRLRAQLTEAQGPAVTGLRKRGGAGPQAGGETVVERAKEAVMTGGSSGVPVEVVAALVVGVFVLTYLFF